jgi:tagatose-6-phosphate ketose/aldose isomerase
VLNDETLTVVMTSPLANAGLYDMDMINELTSQKVKNRVAVVADEKRGYDLSAADYVCSYHTPGVYERLEIDAYIYSLMFLQLLSFEKSYDLHMTTDNPCPGGEVNRVVQGIIIH